jgi:Zn-dependent protease with chaperone function
MTAILATTQKVTSFTDVLPVLLLFAFLVLALWFSSWFSRWSARATVNQLERWIAAAEAQGHRGSAAVESARDFWKRACDALSKGELNDATDLASMGRGQLDCLRKS